MTNTDTKPPKIKHQQKQLLAKKISELGIDGVLYPDVSEGRHPYTQEIMLMAMSKNIKQEDLSRLCGVSQPQISQWANGKGFATEEQLAKLLPRLKNTAPGEVFHKFNVVEKSILDLPEDWEQKSFIAYLKKAIADRLEGMDPKKICIPILEKLRKQEPYDWYQDDYTYNWKNIEWNSEFLETVLYGTLKQEHANQEEDLRKQHKSHLDKVAEKIDELRNLKLKSEQEEQNNQSKIELHSASIQQFYNERPQLINVDEDVKEALALHDHPEPTITHDSKDAYEAFLCSCSEEMGTNANYSNVIEILHHKSDELKEKHDIEISNLKAQQEEEKVQRKILGKYNSDCAVPDLHISDFFQLPSSEIQTKANELYKSKSIDLIIPLKVVICRRYLDKSHEFNVDETIKLDLEQAFIDYCSTLPLRHEQEVVQVAGCCIFTSETVECYRLYSDRLLIKHLRKDGDSKDVHEYIHIDCDGDSAIETIRKINEIYNIDPALEDNLTNALIQKGYLLDSVRTIY
ncbi:helix-turn-helix transcriptional regulator [Vibrio sp. THAF190c]|uniref:helix-turn-helix domain-containing protein n=1 Tax=Vibrio sp. THAF190c TaxID=2587865 RepID=UPI0012694261|nr:helix-turn-helix transcriptional regulator [Vibrio sp. THAF190c]QFT13528.1 Helix-turn-helix protein [Vibrio sp. THAF190c]